MIRCDDESLKQIFVLAQKFLNNFAMTSIVSKILVQHKYVLLRARKYSRDGWGKLQYFTARDHGIDALITEIKNTMGNI